jgi:hypothetical protein
MLPEKFSCPRCKCHALYRTRRKGLDWALSAIGLRPVRCMTCDKRFYLRYEAIKAYDPDPPQRGTGVRGMSAQIEKKVNARLATKVDSGTQSGKAKGRAA